MSDTNPKHTPEWDLDVEGFGRTTLRRDGWPRVTVIGGENLQQHEAIHAALNEAPALRARVEALEQERQTLIEHEAAATRSRDSWAQAQYEALQTIKALEKALRDLLHANGSGPKSCGHDFHCACPYDAARDLLSPRPEVKP